MKLHHADGSSCLKLGASNLPTKYYNITNILVKVHPRTNLEHPKTAILINSHFDSAMGGMGATDAGALVSVILEVFSNILNSNDVQFSLDYPLISFISL